MQDFRDMLGLLKKHGVEFLIVGAHAVGIHDRARATEDLDIWVRASPENAPKVYRALTEFGAPLQNVTIEKFETPGVGLHIGVIPWRIDVMTFISGVDFNDAWPKRHRGKFLDEEVFFVGRSHP